MGKKWITVKVNAALYISIDQIKPFQGDLKHLSDEAFNHLKNEIIDDGFTFAPHVWKHDKWYYILDGHQRIHVLTKLLKEGYCLRDPSLDPVDGIPCCTIEAEDINDAKRKVLQSVAQYGRVTQEGFDLFTEGLEIDLDNFDIPMIELPEVEQEEESEEEREKSDNVPDANENEYGVKRGDIFQLGEHRLMCGDSTSKDEIDRLMLGEKADMVFTDPPYNTGMAPEKQKGSGGLWKGNNEKARLSHMFNDSYTEEEWQLFMKKFCEMYFYILKENTVMYMTLDWRRNHELVPHIKKHFKLSNIIVWDKVVHGLGSDYKYTYELINVCKKGKPDLNTHQGDKEYSDVWHIQRKIGKNDLHATVKPLEIIERSLRHATKAGYLCTDLFLGSGSTLIACEKTNRKCYGMEIDPHYCSVIIKRWEEFTGKKHKKLN